MHAWPQLCDICSATDLSAANVHLSAANVTRRCGLLVTAEAVTALIATACRSWSRRKPRRQAVSLTQPLTVEMRRPAQRWKRCWPLTASAPHQRACVHRYVFVCCLAAVVQKHSCCWSLPSPLPPLALYFLPLYTLPTTTYTPAQQSSANQPLLRHINAYRW